MLSKRHAKVAHVTAGLLNVRLLRQPWNKAAISTTTKCIVKCHRERFRGSPLGVFCAKLSQPSTTQMLKLKLEQTPGNPASRQ